jgi:hypothetical protein
VIRPVIGVEDLSFGKVDGSANPLEIPHIVRGACPGANVNEPGVCYKPFKINL